MFALFFCFLILRDSHAWMAIMLLVCLLRDDISDRAHMCVCVFYRTIMACLNIFNFNREWNLRTSF